MLKRPDLSGLSHEQKDQLIYDLYAQIEALMLRVAELEARLSKDSHNSGKPPSSDGLSKAKKTTSTRESTGKKQGGQKGHKGTGLAFSQEPAIQEKHFVLTCAVCGANLEEVMQEPLAARQVFDIPPPVNLTVTEHQVFQAVCPACNQRNKSCFPEGVDQPVQYGAHLRSAVTYLSQYQLLPVNRVKQLVQDMYGVSLSSGTIQNFIRHLAQKLEPAVQRIKESLLDQVVCHFDESGLRVNGALYWLHTVATPKLTWFGLHKKRGSEAMNEQNILPRYKGIAVHDGWASYRHYDCTHALCNAHHLRELTFIQETTQQLWPAKMKALLLGGLNEKNTSAHYRLDPLRIKDYHTHYLEILNEGDAKNPVNVQNGKRGRTKQTDAVNLLRRLREYQCDVLRFLSDPAIPFTNNEAERAIRMPKLKQKVSGCMRTEQGAEDFCIIRSYMATCKKQAIDLMDSLISVWRTNTL